MFVGNPGTGKTTVARLLSRIYRTLGVVEKGHLVETDRSGLVAGYVGQTATKVVKAFDDADQGTLLIDEAYSLIRGGDDDFGREAIDTIVKLVGERLERYMQDQQAKHQRRDDGAREQRMVEHVARQVGEHVREIVRGIVSAELDRRIGPPRDERRGDPAPDRDREPE